jgi:type IX secretion system PorP/SprF family membrane protein
MRNLLLSMTMLLTISVYGQQLPQYTQWVFNKYAFNPAYAGTNPYWEAVTNNRYQWVGITDAPRTFTLSVQGPFKKENMAMGAYVYTDIVGPTRRIGFQASYAYHAKLSETIKLSFGLSVGFNEWLLDADQITTYDPNDFYFSNGLLKSFDPDGKFGLYLYHPDWYFGASIGQLFHNRVSFLSTQTGSETFMEDHFYFMGGYTFRIGDDWQIEPGALLKMGLPAPLKLDVNLKGTFRDMVWLGAGYRTTDAWTLMGGFKYKNMLSIGYAYDITHTNLKNYNSGTHELMMGIIFGGKKQKEEAPSLE